MSYFVTDPKCVLMSRIVMTKEHFLRFSEVLQTILQQKIGIEEDEIL